MKGAFLSSDSVKSQTCLTSFFSFQRGLDTRSMYELELVHEDGSSPGIDSLNSSLPDCVTSNCLRAPTISSSSSLVVVGCDVFEDEKWVGRITELHGVVLRAAQSLRNRGIFKFKTPDLMLEIEREFPDVWHEYSYGDTLGARLRELANKFKLLKKEGVGIYVIERNWI